MKYAHDFFVCDHIFSFSRFVRSICLYPSWLLYGYWVNMMTSWNGNAFRVTGPLWGEPTGDRWIPPTKVQKRSCEVFFDVSLSKLLNKQTNNRWFETPWSSCDITIMTVYHYNDVIMSTTESQITSLTIVYSTVYSGTDQRKHRGSASLAFVRGIHRWPVNWPVTRNLFPFDDVIMRLRLPRWQCHKTEG